MALTVSSLHRKWGRQVGRLPHARSNTATCLYPSCARTVRCFAKMYVPGDSFAGESPERKAALALKNFFTYTAARVVLFQLEGPGGPRDIPINRSAHDILLHHLQHSSMKDCDEWLQGIMKQDHALGLRLMEVRDAYCSDDFDWSAMAKITLQECKQSNAKIMRDAAMASLQASLQSGCGPLSSMVAEDD